MEALGLSSSVAGFLSLAIELSKILNTYINDVKDAPQEASELSTKVSILSHVLEKSVDILRSDNMETNTFDEQSLLFSVVKSCEHHVNFVYKKLAKLRNIDKVASMRRVLWPFQKDVCLQSIETLHRYAQTLRHLLIVSNR